MPFAAARVGDVHMCPAFTPFTPPVPHGGGGIIGPGCPKVLIGGAPAARATDMANCIGSPVPAAIAKGSPLVFIGGLPAARVLDPTAHGGHVLIGYPRVLIGP